MKPIRTEKTSGTYGAPRGMGESIGGLPYYREQVSVGGVNATEVMSVWTFTADEREAIAQGANIELGIFGEPIPPVSLTLTDQQEVPA